MAKEPAIPLKSMMSAIDTNNLSFYSKLTEEQKKGWSAWMAMRYASSSTGPDGYHYLLMVNSLVNVDFNTLRHHPELQWKLIAVCGKGSSAYHPWIPPGRKGKKDKTAEFLASVYSDYKTQDLEILSSLCTKEDIAQLAAQSGMSDKDIKELLK